MLHYWRRGLGATFAIHVVQTGIAALIASLWANAFATAFAGHPGGIVEAAEGGRIAVETARGLGDTSEFALGYFLIVVAMWWVLSVPLELWWLDRMRGEGSLARTARRTLRGVAASASVWVALSLPLAVLGALPWLWYGGFYDDPDPRWSDLGAIVAGLPVALLGAKAMAWGDGVRAAVDDQPLSGEWLTKVLRRGWRAGSLRRYLPFAIGALVLSVAAVSLPRAALLVSQIVLLFRTLLRAGWLASVLGALDDET